MEKELLDYVKAVYELESMKYQREELIRQLKSETEKPGIGPFEHTEPQYDNEKYNKGERPIFSIYIMVFLVVLTIFCVIGLIGLGDAEALKVGLLFSLAFDGVWGLYTLFEVACYRRDRASGRKEYWADKDDYNKQFRTYQKAHLMEISEKGYIQTQIDYLTTQNAETEKVLNELYDADVIYPKYRSFIPMSSIYDYFASGRTDTLGGPNGAYNLYEHELQMNQIINRLDRVVSLLEQIRDNQYMLYQAVERVRRTNERLCQSVVMSAAAISSQLTQQSELLRQQNASNAQMNAMLGDIKYNTALMEHETELHRKEETLRSNMRSHGYLC